MTDNRASPRGGRRRARELAVQAIYQSLVGQTSDADLQDQFRRQPAVDKSDPEYFTALLAGVLEQRETLESVLQAGLDRPVAQLDPVEHAVLLVAVYEFQHRPDVPPRVTINEAVELAKRFGAEEGHAYVNAVLDRLTAELNK